MTSPNANGRAICNALRTCLAGRTKWDESPALYLMRTDGDTVTLTLALPENYWPAGQPDQALTVIAKTFARTLSLGAVSPGPGFCGFAFRAEVFATLTVPGTAETSEAQAAAYARRLRGHPGSREMRTIWAVSADGAVYCARQARGERAVEARKGTRAAGCVPEALAKMVTAVTAVAN